MIFQNCIRIYPCPAIPACLFGERIRPAWRSRRGWRPRCRHPAGENGRPEMSGRGRGGQRGAAGGQAGNAARGAAGRLFAAIDANQDGVITREEMKEAMQAFAKLDVESGKLTAQEAGGQAGGGRGQGCAGRGGQGQPMEDSRGGARRGGGGGRGDAAGQGGAAGQGAGSSGPAGKGNPLQDD